MKYLQRWQFGSQYEQSLQAELDTCQTYGYDGVLAKALDGTMWMSQVDRNPDAINGPAAVARSVEAAHARGLRFGVWVNPLVQNMDQQASQAIDCLNAGADCIAFDTEPYAGFLGAWPPQGLCDRYAGMIESECPAGVPMIWQPDARPVHLAEVRLEEWAPHMAVYAPQDYWSDFYLEPTLQRAINTLATSRDIAAEYGLSYWPTLPGNAAPDTFPSDLIGEWAEGCVVWRLGSTPTDTLSLIGGIAMGQPAPTVDCSAIEADRAKFDLFFRDLAERVVRRTLSSELARTTKSGAHATIRRKTIEQVLAETAQQYAQAYGLEGMRAMATGQPNPLLAGAHGNIQEGSNPH